jgi:hypothetical protein
VIFTDYAFIKHDCSGVISKEDDMGYKEDHKILRKAGFTVAEMNRLSKLRRNLAEEGKYQELVDYRRLQFVRWLVSTGKLTEQVY